MPDERPVRKQAGLLDLPQRHRRIDRAECRGFAERHSRRAATQQFLALQQAISNAPVPRSTVAVSTPLRGVPVLLSDACTVSTPDTFCAVELKSWAHVIVKLVAAAAVQHDPDWAILPSIKRLLGGHAPDASLAVGEALLMTALGLAVAIPALVAYNALSRWARQLDAELEGFAHDLLALGNLTVA